MQMLNYAPPSPRDTRKASCLASPNKSPTFHVLLGFITVLQKELFLTVLLRELLLFTNIEDGWVSTRCEHIFSLKV